MQTSGICHWLIGRRKVLFIFAMVAMFITLFSAHYTYSKNVHKIICTMKNANKYYFGDYMNLAPIGQSAQPGTSDKIDNETGPETSEGNEYIKRQVSVSKLLSRADKNLLSYPRRKHKLEKKDYKRRLPQALVIGVRKCGTRALLEMLRMHPDVAVANAEQHYFDENYFHDLDWYRKRMPYSLSSQVTIEKTPSYFITEEVPSRIYKMNSTVRLVVIVRDPVTRTISDYVQIKQTMQKNGKVSPPFEELVLKNKEIDINYKAIQISIYQKHLERWLRYFPQEQLHIVDGDRLISDPYPEMKAVESFIGLKDYIQSSNFVYNSTKGFYCMNSTIVTKCLSENKGRAHPDVSTEVLEKLKTFFKPYNELFFQRIGKRFDWD